MVTLKNIKRVLCLVILALICFLHYSKQAQKSEPSHLQCLISDLTLKRDQSSNNPFVSSQIQDVLCKAEYLMRRKKRAEQFR